MYLNINGSPYYLVRILSNKYGILKGGECPNKKKHPLFLIPIPPIPLLLSRSKS